MSEERKLFDQNKDDTKFNSNENQIFLIGSKNFLKIVLEQFLEVSKFFWELSWGLACPNKLLAWFWEVLS